MTEALDVGRCHPQGPASCRVVGPQAGPDIGGFHHFVPGGGARTADEGSQWRRSELGPPAGEWLRAGREKRMLMQWHSIRTLGAGATRVTNMAALEP